MSSIPLQRWNKSWKPHTSSIHIPQNVHIYTFKDRCLRITPKKEEKEKLKPVILYSSILHNQNTPSKWYHYCPSSNASPQIPQSLLHPKTVQPVTDHPYSSSTSRPYTLAYHPTPLAPKQIYSHPHPSS